MPFAVPAFAALTTYVLPLSLPIIVSLSAPPSIELTLPPAASVNVSLPPKPTRFSNPEKLIVPATPLFAPLTVKASAPPVPCSVSPASPEPASVSMSVKPSIDAVTGPVEPAYVTTSPVALASAPPSIVPALPPSLIANVSSSAPPKAVPVNAAVNVNTSFSPLPVRFSISLNACPATVPPSTESITQSFVWFAGLTSNRASVSLSLPPAPPVNVPMLTPLSRLNVSSSSPPSTVPATSAVRLKVSLPAPPSTVPVTS